MITGALLSPRTRAAAGDAAVAGAVAWALSGLPSTVWTVARWARLLASVQAAGTLLLSPGASPQSLLVAGAAGDPAPATI